MKRYLVILLGVIVILSAVTQVLAGGGQVTNKERGAEGQGSVNQVSANSQDNQN